MIIDNPFDRIQSSEFSDNPEPRCAVVLVLDVSSSMSGQPISELNQGLLAFEQSIKQDPLARLRVDVSIITFGLNVDQLLLESSPTEAGIPRYAAFVNADDFKAPVLSANGTTPLYPALTKAMDALQARKQEYRTGNPPVDYYRPWLIVITDGLPNPDPTRSSVVQSVKSAIAKREFTLLAIGVDNADMSTLAELADHPKPVKLRGLAFKEMFSWLSNSLKAVSRSNLSTTGLQLSKPDWTIDV